MEEKATDFKNQREVWHYLSSDENNLVQCVGTGRIIGFKNGELWDHGAKKYAELYMYHGHDWKKYDKNTNFQVGDQVEAHGEKGEVVAVDLNDTTYPVLVAFIEGFQESFSMDGRVQSDFVNAPPVLKLVSRPATLSDSRLKAYQCAEVDMFQRVLKHSDGSYSLDRVLHSVAEKALTMQPGHSYVDAKVVGYKVTTIQLSEEELGDES